MWMRTALLAMSLAAGLAAAAERRPNFLFVYTDDQRWDAMSCVQREQGERARFPWLKTPNMDRIAAEGVRFRNAFVVNALCAPSRATFLTGRYGHVNGIANNHTPFPLDSVTHASLLRKAGYATAYIGKFHMGNQSGPRPGFDFSASFIGQGRYFDCPFEVDGKTVASKGWVDDVSTDYAADFIRKNKDKPFLAVVGYKATHGPFDPPPRRATDYEGEVARPVPNLGVRAIYAGGGADPAATNAPVKTNVGYFRCITAADDNLGRLLTLLDELKLADDTVVVFAGDNGYYLGEHGLGDKRSAYEESIRIPLLLRYPKMVAKGRLEDRFALNVDLAPTFLDYAGLPVPSDMHGRSWRPLFEGKEAPWRSAFFYCYFYERGFARVPMVTAVRTETAKLIRYPGHNEWTELFDLAKDPYELRNLYAVSEAAELRKTLEAAYEREAQAIKFRVPEFADDEKRDAPPANAAPRRRGAGGRAQGPAVTGSRWVLEYRFDKDQGAKVVDASGLGNQGEAKGAPVAAGREGAKARRFDGNGLIEVDNTPSLDPSGTAWTVEAVVKADAPDGMILARGGQSEGYGLYLAGGRPVFHVVGGKQATKIEGKAPVEGWVTLRGTIGADGIARLAVNGAPAGEAKLKAPIGSDPNDTMQIGQDTGSKLLDADNVPPFKGLIESVRLHRGEAP